MLVLTMRQEDKVLIGDPKNPICVVQIVDVCGQKIRVGFDAPRSLSVNREEIANKIIQQGDTPE